MGRAAGLGLAGILAAALALRLFFVVTPHGVLDADEAIVGLMGRHVLRGEFPSLLLRPELPGRPRGRTWPRSRSPLGGASPLALKLVRPRAGARPRVD